MILVHLWISTQFNTQGDLYRSLVFALCIAISFLVVCFLNSNPFGLSRLWTISPQFRHFYLLNLNSLFLWHILETLLRQWYGTVVSLTLFPASQVSLSFMAWNSVIWKPLFHIFLSTWSICLQMGEYILSCPSCSMLVRSRSLGAFLNFFLLMDNCFAGAALKRYPTSKVRETQVTW